MRIRPKRELWLLNLSALLISIASCSFTGLTKGKENSESAVTQIHSQYNAGQFHEIYTQADEQFRKATNEKDFLALFEALHRKLGTVQKSEQATWNVSATTSGTLVTLTYNVEFSEGKGNEQFVFRVSDDKPLLLNYNVNSPLLIIK
jgi:hypothetical protein